MKMNLNNLDLSSLNEADFEQLENTNFQILMQNIDAERTRRSKPVLTRSDAEYLEQYIDICEQYLNRLINNEEANLKIVKLNQTTPDLTSHLRKNFVLGGNLSINNGWVPSRTCW